MSSNTPSSQEKLLRLTAETNGIDPDDFLVSYTPESAVNEFFRHKKDVTDGTITNFKRVLDSFVNWCEEVANIETMTEIRGKHFDEFKEWHKHENPVETDTYSPTTMYEDMKRFRTFIRKCEVFDAVFPTLNNAVPIPETETEDEVDDTIIDAERMDEILDYLNKYEYASVSHVIMSIFSNTGLRVSGIWSLDKTDFKKNEHGYYLQVRHRPEAGTRLKNKSDGNRNVAVPDKTAEVVDDYIDEQRTEVTDDNGRKPLITSEHGRLNKSTIRKWVYRWTCPCKIGNECPIDEKPCGDDEYVIGGSPDKCKAAQNKNYASKCPGSVSTHPTRKGYITHEREEGIPIQILSDRCDVSERILEKHYDMSDEEKRMNARREMMDEVRSD